jgi:hypothetical protein
LLSGLKQYCETVSLFLYWFKYQNPFCKEIKITKIKLKIKTKIYFSHLLKSSCVVRVGSCNCNVVLRVNETAFGEEKLGLEHLSQTCRISVQICKLNVKYSILCAEEKASILALFPK